MFERYTENARRVIFFARYEASQYGSPNIEVEHLLLGLLRESQAMVSNLLPNLKPEAIRERIDSRSHKRSKISTSVDLPLSNESKRVLAYAVEEAECLSDSHIGSEHLLLALLREETSAAELLQEQGAQLVVLRSEIAKHENRFSMSPRSSPRLRHSPTHIQDTVNIHGSPWKVDYLHDIVGKLKEYSWHWNKQDFKNRDIVISRDSGTASFDLSLAQDGEHFALVKGGWKKDHCAICRWELLENAEDATHRTGYTNGRDWLCIECYENFFKGPDFFKSTYPEIT